MAAAVKISGGCYCGDITITVKVLPDKIMGCDCTDCQKFSGAPFGAVAVIRADDLNIFGYCDRISENCREW